MIALPACGAGTITFDSRQIEGLEVGQSPRLRFSISDADFTRVTAYLRKDGKMLGIIYGTVTLGRDRKSCTLDWPLTQYTTNGVSLFPRGGTNYTVLIGLRKSATVVPPEQFSIATFDAFDESTPFAIEFKMVIIKKPDFGLQDGLTMIVLTVPGRKYSVSYSRFLPPTWGPPSDFLATSESATLTARSLNPIAGFFRIEESKMGLASIRRSLQQQVATFTFTPN